MFHIRKNQNSKCKINVTHHNFWLAILWMITIRHYSDESLQLILLCCVSLTLDSKMVAIFIAFKVVYKLTSPFYSNSLIIGWLTLQLQVIRLKFCPFLYEFTITTVIQAFSIITTGLEASEFPKITLFFHVSWGIYLYVNCTGTYIASLINGIKERINIELLTCKCQCNNWQSINKISHSIWHKKTYHSEKIKKNLRALTSYQRLQQWDLVPFASSVQPKCEEYEGDEASWLPTHFQSISSFWSLR